MKQKVDVSLDVNEPPKMSYAIDKNSDVENLELVRLDACDIEIEGVGFERKTVSDYINTMKGEGSRTFEDQLYKMTERYGVCYILIDGDMSETESPFKTQMLGSSIRGHMASVTARESNSVRAVIPCSNTLLLVDMAVRLARKHVEDESRSYVPKPAIGMNEPTTKMMYACIDGIDAELSQRLYQVWPSISKFTEEVTYDKLTKIDGIGEKKAAEIINSIV